MLFPSAAILALVTDAAERTFGASYFAEAYGPHYARRNPPRKWRAFLREIARFRTAGDLLDVGCAYGLFLREASRLYRCGGCDISAHALGVARRLLPPEIPLFAARLGELPTGRRYDIVTCFDILEHVSDLDRALADVRAHLRPGGILVATMPVYDGPLGWLVDRLDHDETHVHRRGRDFWMQRFGAHFTVRRCTGIWRYFALHRWYLNVVSRATRRVTPAILLVAERTEGP